MISRRSLWEDLVEILMVVRSSLTGSCMKILQMPCLRGHCLAVLVGCFGSFLYRNLVGSSPAAGGLLLTILWHEDLGQSLWQLLVRGPRGDPSEMLSEAFAWSCTGPCEKLLKRSPWNPLGVRTWSRTGTDEKILWRSRWNPPHTLH